MLQKVRQIVCEASECDLQFSACVLHPKEALHRETLEGVAVLPHFVILHFERPEPRAIGGVLVAFGGKDAPLGVGDVGFKHEHPIQFGIVVGVHIVLVPLLEVFLNDFADGCFVKHDIVLAVGVVLAIYGRIGKHERSRQHTAFSRFGKSLRGLGEGLEGFLNGRHINEGHELHAFVHFVHGHSVNGKFHVGICSG